MTCTYVQLRSAWFRGISVKPSRLTDFWPRACEARPISYYVHYHYHHHHYHQDYPFWKLVVISLNDDVICKHDQTWFINWEKCSHGQGGTCFKMRKNYLVFFLRNFSSMWEKYSKSYFSRKLKFVVKADNWK